MTYLEIVNKVLVRLREDEVTSVNQTTYSKLIGSLVNATKRDIENAWNWHCLRETLTVTTSSGLFNYVLTDFGTTSRVLHVYNDTDDVEMYYRSSKWFDHQFRMTDTPQNDSPMYYSWNGTSSGDIQVDVYPIPDGTYNLRFNIVKQQDDLDASTDVPLIDQNLLIEGTLARAISERGEDGGGQDQMMRFRNMLADYIAIEAGHVPDETTWYPL